MSALVLKFGGTSVESPDHLLDVARRILEEKRRGHGILVVVSAMGQATDDLTDLARRVSPHPPRREMDMLLTAGERISMALLAIALDSLGVPAISFTGSQSGIITDERHSDAKIVAVRPIRITEELERGRVVIVAGFQGVSAKKEITTLGRGGSDTTAVALAVRFGSPRCEIFTDVHGVMSADPRLVPQAQTLPRIGYEMTIVLSHLGAQVLFRRAVILARKFRMPLRVRCSRSVGAETWIAPTTEEEAMSTPDPIDAIPMESERVLSVALEPRCVSFEVSGGGDPETLLEILEGDDPPSIWTWVETHAAEGGAIVRAVRPRTDRGSEAIERRAAAIGARVRCREAVSVVSLVGEGILARPALLIEAAGCLRAARIETLAARTGSLSVSFLVAEDRATDAARALHARFVESAEGSE